MRSLQLHRRACIELTEAARTMELFLKTQRCRLRKKYSFKLMRCRPKVVFQSGLWWIVNE